MTLPVMGQPDYFLPLATYPDETAIPPGHPGLAQVAYPLGKYVGTHLTEFYKGVPVKPFRFDKGHLATIGREKAVADLPAQSLFWRKACVVDLAVRPYPLSWRCFRNKLWYSRTGIWTSFTFDKGNSLIILPYQEKKMSLGHRNGSNECFRRKHKYSIGEPAGISAIVRL